MSVKNLVDKILECVLFMRKHKLCGERSVLDFEGKFISASIRNGQIKFEIFDKDVEFGTSIIFHVGDAEHNKERMEHIVIQSLIAFGHKDPDSAVAPV